MGKAANARGTYEERRAMAIERNTKAQVEKEEQQEVTRVHLANLASEVHRQLAAKQAMQAAAEAENTKVRQIVSLGRRAGLSLLAVAARAAIPGIKQ